MARLSLRMSKNHEKNRVGKKCGLQDVAEDFPGEAEVAARFEEA